MSGTAELDGETGASGSTSGAVGPSDASSSSTAPDDPSDPSDASSSEAGAESSSGGETGGCCHSGCSAVSCTVGPCEDTVIGTPTTGIEALDVVTVGEHVVWSTGWERSLLIADPAQSTTKELVQVESNQYITNIAADDTHVYFLDYGGGTVHRASVPVGVLDLVTVVAGGQAQNGSLALGDDYVYVAMNATGGIWRARKDLADQVAAASVIASPAPLGVAVDDTHLYWTDAMTQQLRRLDLNQIGIDLEGAVVVDGVELGEIVLREDGVYYSDAGSIRRAVKDGVNEGITTFASDQGFVEGLAVDDHDVYWTSAMGWVGRAALDSSGVAQQLALSESARGLALDCDGIYWLSNLERSQALHRLAK